MLNINFQQKNETTWHTYFITGVIKYMRLVFIAHLLNVRTQTDEYLVACNKTCHRVLSLQVFSIKRYC